MPGRRSQKKKLLSLRRLLPTQNGSVQNACYGIPAEVIARLCQVDIATARRWKSGKSRIPYAAVVLLEGDLGAFGKHWRGWTVRDDTILSPDGWRINRNDALSVPLLLAQVDALRQQVADLKDWLEKQEQPAPGAEIPQIIA